MSAPAHHPAEFFPESAPTALAAQDPRSRLGGWLLHGGLLAMSAGLAMSLALMHAGLACSVLGMLLLRSPIHRLPGFWWAIAYGAWQVLSMAVSAAQGGEPMTKRGYGSAYTSLAFFAAIIGFRTDWVRLWAVLLASMCATVSLVLAVLQFSIGFGGRAPFRIMVWEDGSNRWTSAGFFPLHLTQGFMMTQIMLMAWSQPLADGWKRVVQWIGRIAPLFCVLLTGGRTGPVAAIAGWSAWFGSGGWRRLLLAAGVAMAGLLLLVGWLFIIRPIRITDTVALKDGRIIHWQVARELIAEHPLLGVGGAHDFKRENNLVLARLYPDGSQNTWLNAPDAHNSFLGIGSEHGIPAVIFYLGFLAAVMFHLWRFRQTHPWAWRLGCGLVVSTVCAGQFEHLAGHSTTCYGLFVPLGFAVALTYSERRTPSIGV